MVRRFLDPEVLGDPDDLASQRLELALDRFGAWRANSLHKLDTLITALRVFRQGLEAEFAEYDRREQKMKELKGE